jgi:glycosyltransferase involved in cell wall biosynthesis
MNVRSSERLLFVVAKGRLDPASHKRVYDLAPLFWTRGYRVSVAATEWELLWRIRTRIAQGHEGLRRLVWLLNAARLTPALIAAREARELRRFERLARRSAVVIVNQKILEPKWIAALRRSGARLVYDVDDAVWVNDEAGFAAMLGLADAVVVGNRYLADHTRPMHGAVHVIPTGVRIDRYGASGRGGAGDRERFTVGWVGSPSTARHLEMLVEPLAEFGRGRPVAVEIVGTGPERLPDFRGVEVRSFPELPYDPADHVPRFDVGVMPLPDGEFERGKCGAKALEYMAAGVPAVCSPVGENVNIVEHGVSGFLAADAREWVAALDRLASDDDLRRRMGEAGRERVRREYSADLVVDRWEEVLRAVCAAERVVAGA